MGQDYIFTIISNNKDWKLKIESENLSVSLNKESEKSTGGLMFKVTPLYTGDCQILLSVINDKGRQVGLKAMNYHASKCPIPPVFIDGIRSGEIIHELKKSAELTCKYGYESGIFEEYPVLSWSAELKNKIFSGTGTKLSMELIEEINSISGNGILKLTVVLSENTTGHKTSEAVYLIK